MKFSTRLFALVTCCILFPLFADGEIREWTRASDGKKISASFVGMKGEGVIQIKMANGQVFDVPLSSLSPADNEFVAGLNAPAAEKMEEKPGTPAEKATIPDGETTVVLSGVAIFCRDCVERIEGLKESEENKVDPSVELSASRSDQTVTIKAPTGKLALATVRKIQGAGYYGTSDVPGIAMSPLKEDDFTTDTMVVRDAAVVCSGGVKAFEKAVESVDGVDKVDAKSGSTRIKVEGEGFKTYEVMKALREAGFGGRFQ